MSADLAALLAEEQDHLAEGWARSLGRQAPAFAHRSVHDLKAAGRAAIDGLVRYLQTGDPTALRTAAGSEGVLLLVREADLPEILRGLMALREQAAHLLGPRLKAASGDPYARLVAAFDLMLVEVAREAWARREPSGEPAAELERHLSKEVRRALRFRRPLALLLVHLDGYEERWRLHGAAVAEAALGMVHEIVTRHTREVDLRLPLEGGTLAVLLLETDLARASRVAERIRAAAETQEGVTRSSLVEHLTVSVGLAAFPLHGDRPPALLAAAQDSLLRARRLGGNTVVSADDLRSGEPVA
ncbi:MAG: diguanylate cyclase [Armatimonadota bacterium]|nr:diguanylate cyclase [Armatimonadota bacterium]MDR7428151.1 diguanylate cyclase [Armatimonadota bacterium]MDR7470969.1 diguanylate cyclase [Armatimonadota bacterium]MDR7473634.1 diguanylate cyclase [Armatimonadota bacterium]MDR7538845.1 diguanylate cyclase [Armatimonadota bacterium]